MKRVAEDARDETLEIEIDVRVEGRRRHRQQVRPRGALPRNDSAARVDLDELTSLAAAQLRLVRSLQPSLAHLLARLVVDELRLRELGLAYLACVTDERRDDRPIGVEPPRRGLNDQPRKLDAVLLQHAHDVERRVR